MNIAITGTSKGLGKALSSYFKALTYSVVELNENISAYKRNIVDKVKGCDVFINCAHNSKIQSELFVKVYYAWEGEHKTIVNILSSGLYFGSHNQTYLEEKKHLEDMTKAIRNDKKYVRVVNLYPNTLENSGTPFPEVKYNEIGLTLNFILNLPEDLEVFQIGLTRTTTVPRISLI